MVFSEEQQTLSFPTDTIQPVIFYNTGSGFTWRRGNGTQTKPFIEQNLRIYRFNHNEETPLDITGEPKFWRPDMQENTHRMNVSGYQTKK